MNNKYYLATVLLALGAFSPLYGVQNAPPPPPHQKKKKKKKKK